jgi:pimeloyl-ACP methyl ester carboxylesterase
MATFVLAHGSWHGAWCWERVVPLLRERGHEVRTPELGFEDPQATTDSVIAAVEAVITEPEETVLVAHSAAGVVAPVIAERLPLRELVLLTSMLPATGLSFREQVASAPGALLPAFAEAQARQPASPDGGVTWGRSDAYDFFYHDCDRADAETAISKLRPRNAVAPFVEKTPWTGGSVGPTRFVACVLDQVLDPVWAAKTAAERYGATIMEIETSHSPFWSRPAELAELLLLGH